MSTKSIVVKLLTKKYDYENESIFDAVCMPWLFINF